MPAHPDTSPFPLHHALNKERLQERNDDSPPPTASTVQISHVPDQPAIDLTFANVHNFLFRELQTPLLDELYPRFWLVGRKDGENIDPLHRQQVKGRAIVPTEDPKLHLTWERKKTYLKPVPVCLLNYDFWKTFLAFPSTSAVSNRSAAIGFVRSYSHLIQHRLDFILAQQHHLLPDGLNWTEWSVFIAHFRPLDDSQAAPRYHYGQLRLSRLNWAVRILQPRNAPTAWFYEIPFWSTVSYLEGALGPLIFIFASLSVVLSSMQVVISVPSEWLWPHGNDAPGMRAMGQAFRVFSILLLCLSGVVWTLMVFLPISILFWQMQWGFRNRDSRTSRSYR